MEMSGQQDMGCPWGLCVDGHTLPPFFCALHFALEEVAMRTREDGISDAVSDMGIIWFWVIEVHEFGEVC